MAYTASSVAGGEGNTTHVVTDETFLGKPLEFVIVDMISAVNAKTAKDSTRDVVQKTIGTYANIVGAGALINSNTEQNFIVCLLYTSPSPRDRG